MAQFSTSPGGAGDHRQTSVFSQSGKGSNYKPSANVDASECESGVGETGSVPSRTPVPIGGGTLSLDINAPLAGAQRVEKIQQMIKSHSAFQSSHKLQGFIAKTQTSLLRMPGVASIKAKEVNDGLQDIALLVSRDYMSLLENHAQLTLDHQDTERCVERLSRDANQSKRELEEKMARLDQLFESYGKEHGRRERYEADIRGIGEYLTGLATQLRAVRHKVLGGCEASTHSELVLDLDKVISGLDDRARATPCGSWAGGSSSSSSGGGRVGGVSTPRPSNALVRAAEQETQQNTTPMSPANKNAVTDRLKALFDGRATDAPASGNNANSTNVTTNTTSRSLMGNPRTPINGRSIIPSGIGRSPSRNSFSPLGRGASPGPGFGPSHGHNYSRSRGSGWNMNNTNNTNHYNGFGGGVGGPRSRTASTSANSMPFQPPPGVMARRGTGSFFNFSQAGRYTSHSNNSFPNGEFTQTSVFSPSMRSDTTVDSYDNNNNNSNNYRDSRHPNTMAVGFSNRNRSGSSGVQDPFQGPGPYAGTVAALPATASTSPAAAQLTDVSVQRWQRQIRHFYQTLHSWVERHASPERPREDVVVSSTLWPVLLRTYRPLSTNDAASYLEFHLRENLSRYCLVTRVVVDYVVNLVWAPGGWKGADTESTLALSELEREMKQTEDLPSYQRQPLLDRQADIIDSILHRPSASSDFLGRRVQSAATSLLNNLVPLLANHSDPDTATELGDVLKQAYDISSVLLTSRVSFDYRFPLIGCRFTAQSMVNVWPGDVEPLELQARHWRVALVTTPVITCRSDNGTDISAHAVSHADVFCMQ